MVTSGFATTPDHPRGAMLRAYDQKTGKEVGNVLMPAGQSGSPMTYMVNGKQYIIVAVSGGNYSGEYICYTLLPTTRRGSAYALVIRTGHGCLARLRVIGAAAQPTCFDMGWRLYRSAGCASRRCRALPSHCASCHGASVWAARAKPRHWLGAQFLSDFDTAEPVGDLFDRIRTTMPQGISRPASPRDQYADILAYRAQGERLCRPAPRNWTGAANI